MKKISIVSISFVTFLLISSFMAYALKDFSFIWPYNIESLNILMFGLSALALSGLCAIFKKKNIFLNLICFLINAISFGFMIIALIKLLNFTNYSIATIILATLACVACVWIFYLLAKTPFFKKHFKFLYGAHFVIVFFSTIFVFCSKNISVFAIYLFAEIPFVWALISKCKGYDEFVKSLTNATFMIYGSVIIIITSGLISMVNGVGGDIPILTADKNGMDDKLLDNKAK